MSPSEKAVLLGDCLALLPLLPSCCVDAVITDPPYGIGYVSHRVPEERKKEMLEGDAPEDTGPLLAAAFRECYRVLKPGGCALVFAGGGPTFSLGLVYNTMHMAGFNLENVLVWDKLVFGQGWRYRFQWEAISIFYKGDKRLVWNGGEGIGNVLRYQVKGHLTPWQELHPTPKPLPLMLRLVADNTDPGALVVDPFCGTGSTLVACARLGRRFVGVEKKSEYAQAAREWQAADAKFSDRRALTLHKDQGVLFDE